MTLLLASSSPVHHYVWTDNKVSMKHLHEVRPELQDKVIHIMNKLEDEGYQPVIAEGLRTVKEERKKVRQGYSHTMHSMHIIGKAVDIVDKRYYWEGPASNLKFKFWLALGKAVHEEQGLKWGGDWKHFKDVAHVQLPKKPGDFK